MTFSTWTGTHDVEFMGIPPTGRHVTVEAWALDRYHDDQLAENRIIMDVAGMLTQIGIIPPPEGRAIALLGLVGYAALTIGVPLDLLGLLDMSTGAGLLLVVPGGLFEVVFLPIWLIAKGFNASQGAVNEHA
jgi:hypothetical protein